MAFQLLSYVSIYIWIFNCSFYSSHYHPKWIVPRGMYFVARNYFQSPSLGAMLGVWCTERNARVWGWLCIYLSGSQVWEGQPVYPQEPDDACIFPDGEACPSGPWFQRRRFVYVWKTWGERLPALARNPHFNLPLSSWSPFLLVPPFKLCDFP